MMRKCVLLLVLLALAGCADSPDTRFFVLEAVPPSEPASNASGDPIAVDAIRIPDYLDRPELVRRLGRHRIHVSSVNRWGAPIASMIREVLIENLEQRLPRGLVSAPGQHAGPSRPLLVRIYDFALNASGRVELDADWSLFDDRGNVLLRRREKIEVEPSEISAAAQAEGMSRALATLADRIVAALVSGAD